MSLTLLNYTIAIVTNLITGNRIFYFIYSERCFFGIYLEKTPLVYMRLEREILVTQGNFSPGYPAPGTRDGVRF